MTDRQPRSTVRSAGVEPDGNVPADRATATLSQEDAKLPIRAAYAAFGPGPVDSAALPRRRATSELTAAAKQLFAQVNPTEPASYARVLCPPLPNFYPRRVLQPSEEAVPLGYTLAETVTNGWPLYLQGAALGVGASTLAADYARQFNFAAHAAGDSRRAVYIHIQTGTRTPKHLFDTLAVALRAPLTTAEVRFRSTTYLAARLLATAAQLRGVLLVLDPVGALTGGARAVLAGLVRALDPAFYVALDGVAGAPPRVGIVLVDHAPPEEMFAGDPDIVGVLRGRHAVLTPYTSVEQVGEALELTNVGVGTFHADDSGDRLMALRILELTSGLAVQLNPFLSRLGVIARRLNRRPSVEMVEAVMPYHRQMLKLYARPANVPGASEYETRVIKRGKRRSWRAANAAASRQDESREDTVADEGGAAGADGGPGEPTAERPKARSAQGARAAVLKKKGSEREKTAGLHRKLNRRGYSTT